ncbi:hypothetical protein ACEWY4_017077 [Coilia grayii]|uniref:Uncharacterized protein n=1 Tax=Coilia grayii TaxID=363190 RepID=A0ABD1JFS9_9TELE
MDAEEDDFLDRQLLDDDEVEISAKFNLPNGADVELQDSLGVDVDDDIFDELLRSATVSFKAFIKNSADREVSEASFCSDEGASFSVESTMSSSSIESVSSTRSSASTVIIESTKAQKRQLVEGPPDSKVAKDLVYVALLQKPGGEEVVKEYNKTNGLSDHSRRKLVNILVADMIESHGRIPPVNVRITYALGIVTLFPNLKDKASPTGYEHYYNPQSGQGYLAYRLKTVQRNTASDSKKMFKSVHQGGLKTLRETSSSEQLSGNECNEAMSMMKHTTDQVAVKEKMKATFKHRQQLLRDPDQSALILHFPRFLDTPGLIDQDFTMLFGENVSGKFIAKWPTFYKPRIITIGKGLRPGLHLDDLLSAQEASNDYGWDSDLAAILLLLHLLPPTAKGKMHGKISAANAADHVVKFMKCVGTSMVTYLQGVASTQPFLLCVGEKKSKIQKYYIILDQKALPCVAQTVVAAFDELFKAHFVFAVAYDEALFNFYTFIQTTVYGIDVATAKESPRVKEIRVRIDNI